MVSDHYCLQRRVAESGADVKIHIQHQKMDQDVHLLNTNLPPPAAHTSNEPNAANSVGCGWYKTTRLCGRAAAGEVDLFNIIFAHKNTDYKANTHLSPPKTPRPLLRINRKRGGAKECQTSSEGFEWLAGSTEKLVSCRGRKWSAEGQTMMATDDRRASVGG
jgi:hypothetical protein